MLKKLFEVRGQKFLLDPDDIEPKIWAGDNNVYSVKAVGLDVDALNAALRDYPERITDDDDLQDFLQSLNIAAEISGLPEYITPANKIVYDTQSAEFSNLADWENVPYYKWWDGSDWRDETSERVTDVEITDSVNLDEWNGHDWQTGGIGSHVSVAKVLTEDGDKAEGEYLVIYRSQWQGEHTTAEVVSASDLPGILAELDRDADEYMPRIKALGGEADAE